VTTSSGVVEALSENTGIASWSHTLASAITAAPALDTAASRLVIGEVNGVVMALSTTNGATQWSYLTGAAVTASPTVSGGTVYVGSSDDNVYALSESTGVKQWSYATGGAVTDTGALTNQITPAGALELIIGSGDGSLYALQASNGSLNYSISLKSPIVGIAAVRGVAVFDTAAGLIGSARTYVDLDVWKYQTGAATTSAPVVVDGTIYVGAGDGSVYAFTSYGQPPT
jgi:serine/threonine-protein kinase